MNSVSPENVREFFKHSFIYYTYSEAWKRSTWVLFPQTNFFAKLLASRIDTIIPEIISPDQTGFIRGHHFMVFCIPPASREVLELMVYSWMQRRHLTEWSWAIYAILKQFGFGLKCISCVQLLYSNLL